MKQLLALLLICFSTSFSSTAQNNQQSFSTIDEVIKGVYSVISGPAGERDWDMFRNIFKTEALMGMVIKDDDGKTIFHSFTPQKYIEVNGAMFLENAFYEVEIDRAVREYGGIAQVFSTYQYGFEEGKFEQRGVNSFQLVYENDRWYITQLIWQPESADLPLPDFNE